MIVTGLQSSCAAPAILPPGWRSTGRLAVGRINGLRATVAEESYPSADEAPLRWPGNYWRVVLSRDDEKLYPGWDEMQAALRALPWGRKDRDWFMLVVPESEHVNIRRNAFHWWQRRGGGA